MSLVFETVRTEGIAVLTYLVGDDATGVAAIFDPCADVDRYLELARRKKVAITHVFETHIHADLVSGSCELRHRLGEAARVYASVEGGARYGFEHTGVRDGDRFELGCVTIVARHTPGHTPEHLSYLLHESGRPEVPWGVLSGDALFAGSAGRPDLLGAEHSQRLAAQQFRTLREFYLGLPDGVMVFPAHGAGSPCGAGISDRLSTTIGYERRFNGFLQLESVEEFTRHALSTAPPRPTYYPRLKKVNAEGPSVHGRLPEVPALPPTSFREAIDNKAGRLVDARDMLAFGGGHIPGAWNLGGAPVMSLWAGWMLEPEEPLLLVVDEGKLETVVRLLLRTGYDRFAGYLLGGMGAWDNAGFPLAQTGQMTVHQLKEAGGRMQLVDVRSPAEWAAGHIPGALYHFLPGLGESMSGLDPEQPTAVYCQTGYRASLACSLLQAAGFRSVHNVPGSFSAWRKMGYPIVKEEKTPEVALR
jgi:hydroxyacylglutathione hydrolase